MSIIGAEPRERNWKVLLFSLALLGIVAIGLLLSAQGATFLDRPQLLPISLRSSLDAKYGIDPHPPRAAALRMDLVVDVIQEEQPSSKDAPGRIATLSSRLQTPVQVAPTKIPRSSATPVPSPSAPAQPTDPIWTATPKATEAHAPASPTSPQAMPTGTLPATATLPIATLVPTPGQSPTLPPPTVPLPILPLPTVLLPTLPLPIPLPTVELPILPLPTLPLPVLPLPTLPLPALPLPTLPPIIEPLPTVALPALPPIIEPLPTVSLPALPPIIKPLPTVALPALPPLIKPLPTRAP